MPTFFIMMSDCHKNSYHYPNFFPHSQTAGCAGNCAVVVPCTAGGQVADVQGKNIERDTALRQSSYFLGLVEVLVIPL